MGTERPRILIVEDESDIRELISLHLQREGYRVDEVADGESALTRIETTQYSLLVLDWMLPGTSGIEITRSLRKKTGWYQTSPILMVTARAEPADVVLGLEAGADDYVTKPFEVPVLLARVRALLRRASMLEMGSAAEASGGDGSLLVAGNLVLNTAAYEVTCSGEKVPVTPSEFKLLTALLKNQGRVMTRSRLIDEVQGSDVSVVDRTVDTHVFGLRKKLGACGDIIETIRGVGYRVRM